MKPLHLPLEGHDLLAVERFKDDTTFTEAAHKGRLFCTPAWGERSFA